METMVVGREEGVKVVAGVVARGVTVTLMVVVLVARKPLEEGLGVSDTKEACWVLEKEREEVEVGPKAMSVFVVLGLAVTEMEGE